MEEGLRRPAWVLMGKLWRAGNAERHKESRRRHKNAPTAEVGAIAPLIRELERGAAEGFEVRLLLVGQNLADFSF